MIEHKGFKFVTTIDIEAAMDWIRNTQPAGSYLSDTILTGLSYAVVVCTQMGGRHVGGLPCFPAGQSEEERRAAMALAARIIRQNRKQVKP